jgi:hypothetical protein
VAWGRQRKWCCGIAGCEGSRRKRLGGRLASRHRYLLPAGPPVLRRPVETTSNSGQTRAQLDCPLCAASSTGRCNTGVKSLCWGFKLQGLTRSFIELTRHFVQIGLRVHRQVGSLRKVLSQQTVGVLIGTALPRTLRIAEVNVDDILATSPNTPSFPFKIKCCVDQLRPPPRADITASFRGA